MSLHNIKKILVIDGQGGKLGKQLIEAIKARIKNIEVTAIGTNGIATSTMLKGGADYAATGENPVIVACRKADIIIGPIGIVIADSLMGEITPKMATAISQSNALRILIPANKCDNIIVGVPDLSMSALISDTINKLTEFLSSNQ
ncbi:MAG TPA: DUF3842 family protein [Clostridiaceae bacterium]|jgi:hypothetical protein|nr:DUF3842 family protein [Clostridiaceae bacterium]